jgi:predicted Fe-S protein YdhL (DUF1289 family)
VTETPSPCLNICEIDPSGELCVGCGRTLDEIAGWQGASEAKRRAIVDELPERLLRLKS